jgi:site-specific recombinase XerD
MKHLPIYNERFEKLLLDFKKDVGAKNYARGEMNCTMVREFLFFLESKGITEIKQVKSAEIISYYEYIRERPNYRREGALSESMIRHHLFSLRLFFDYLLDAGEINSSPARLPKFSFCKSKPRNVPDIEEMKLIYATCESKRDRAIISAAYGCGLRRSEIEKLNLGDVLFKKAQLIVRDGKGGKHRTIPLSDRVIKDLQEYLLYERTRFFSKNSSQPSAAFFVYDNGERMRGVLFNDRLKYLIQKTKNAALILKQITLHCLRHAFATHLLDNGATIEFVQSLMGHAQLDTVHIYSKKRKQQMAVKNQFDNYYARTHI